MRRSLLDCGRSIVAGSALLALVFTPAIAEDGAPKAPASGSSTKSTSANNAGGRSGPTQGKILYTVPEDGMVAEDVPSSSRLVRDLISQHPAEDVIICLAGCRTSKSRVVYAQPADPVAAKAATKVSEQESEPPVKPAIANSIDEKAKVSPAATNTTANPADAKPVAETAKSEPARSEAANADAAKAATGPSIAPVATPAPAAAAAPAAAKPADGKDALPQLVPTMALDKAAVPAAPGTAASDAAVTTPPPAETPAATPAVPADAAPAAK